MIPPAICILHLEVSILLRRAGSGHWANDRSISRQFWLRCSAGALLVECGCSRDVFTPMLADYSSNVIQIGECFRFGAVTAVTPLWAPEGCDCFLHEPWGWCPHASLCQNQRSENGGPGASGHLCLHLRICKCNYWESLRPSHVQTHIALQMVIKVDGVTAPPWMKSSRLTSSVCFLSHPLKIIQILTFFWVGCMVSLSSATYSCNIWIRWSFCSICNELFSCSHCFQLVIASLPAILLCFFTTL